MYMRMDVNNKGDRMKKGRFVFDKVPPFCDINKITIEKDGNITDVIVKGMTTKDYLAAKFIYDNWLSLDAIHRRQAENIDISFEPMSFDNETGNMVIEAKINLDNMDEHSLINRCIEISKEKDFEVAKELDGGRIELTMRDGSMEIVDTDPTVPYEEGGNQ